MLVWLLLAVATARLDFGQAGDRSATSETYWSQWKEFQVSFEKKYTTAVEHDYRFKVFMDNVDKINTHNAEGHSWTMGVNQFADMTGEEFKNRTACMRGLQDNHGERVKELEENAPSSVDWDAQGKVTPVKNQGQCGSCWAFSTTGAVESRAAIAAQAGSPTSLSEQELVDCSLSDGNNGCNGGLMDYGFKYVEEQGGLCSETDYPYQAETHRFSCSSSRAACSQKYDSISSYNDVRSRSMDQLAAAVAAGPVSIAIEADQSAFQLYKSGVFDGRCGKQLDHGVLVVGYGTENGADFWKVKNSWGATWGEQGYIKLCKNCGKNQGSGQCGILLQPSYPVV